MQSSDHRHKQSSYSNEIGNILKLELNSINIIMPPTSKWALRSHGRKMQHTKHVSQPAVNHRSLILTLHHYSPTQAKKLYTN